MRTYPGRITEVVDGDTLDATLDLGFGLTYSVRLRLQNVDTAEVYGVSHDSTGYRRGRDQSEFTRHWVEANDSDAPFPLTIRAGDRGKYGRILAIVENADGESLNSALKNQFDSL